MDNSEYLDVMIKAAVRQLADDRQPLTSTSLFNLLMRTLANRLRFATTSGRFFALNCTENTTEVLMDVEVLRQTRSVLIGSGQTMLAALIMSVTEIFQAFSQGPDYVDLFRFLKLTYKTELEDAEFQRLFDFSLNKMKNDQMVDQIDGRFVFQDFVVSQSQCFKDRSGPQVTSPIPSTSLTSVPDSGPNISSPASDHPTLGHQIGLLSARDDPLSPMVQAPTSHSILAAGSPGSSTKERCDSGGGSSSSMVDRENSNPTTPPVLTTSVALTNSLRSASEGTVLWKEVSLLPQPASPRQRPLLANPTAYSLGSSMDQGTASGRASSTSMAFSEISSASRGGPESPLIEKALPSVLASSTDSSSTSVDEQNTQYGKNLNTGNYAANKGIRRGCGKQMRGSPAARSREGYKLFIQMKNSGVMTKEALESAFSPYGKAKDVHMPEGKRFALVTFDTLEAADRAGSMLNGRVINDVKISCEWADPHDSNQGFNDGGTRQQRRSLKRAQPEHLKARDYHLADGAGQASGFGAGASGQLHHTPPSRGPLQRISPPVYQPGPPTDNRPLQESYYEQHGPDTQFTSSTSSNQYSNGRCLLGSNEWRGDIDNRLPFHSAAHFPQQPRQALIPEPSTAPSNVVSTTFFSRQPVPNNKNTMPPRGNINGQGPRQTDSECMQRMTNSRAYVPQTNFLVDCQSNRGLSKRKMGNGFASEAEDWRAGRR